MEEAQNITDQAMQVISIFENNKNVNEISFNRIKAKLHFFIVSLLFDKLFF